MKTEILMYGLIAGLTALIGTTDPFTWRQGVAVALAVCIAVKAKRSPGVDTETDKPGDAEAQAPQ